MWVERIKNNVPLKKKTNKHSENLNFDSKFVLVFQNHRLKLPFLFFFKMSTCESIRRLYVLTKGVAFTQRLKIAVC